MCTALGEGAICTFCDATREVALYQDTHTYSCSISRHTYVQLLYIKTHTYSCSISRHTYVQLLYIKTHIRTVALYQDTYVQLLYIKTHIRTVALYQDTHTYSCSISRHTYVQLLYIKTHICTVALYQDTHSLSHEHPWHPNESVAENLIISATLHQHPKTTPYPAVMGWGGGSARMQIHREERSWENKWTGSVEVTHWETWVHMWMVAATTCCRTLLVTMSYCINYSYLLWGHINWVLSGTKWVF
jgi:hypothetical protein